MKKTNAVQKNDETEFYQIRIHPMLKIDFMRHCYEMALNPSAVMRMLMSDWTKKNKLSQNPAPNVASTHTNKRVKV